MKKTNIFIKNTCILFLLITIICTFLYFTQPDITKTINRIASANENSSLKNTYEPNLSSLSSLSKKSKRVKIGTAVTSNRLKI